MYAAAIVRLQSAILLARRKRFLADVRLDDGTVLTAHLPNSGAMTGCAEPGMPVLLSRSDAANRRLPHTLELVRVGRTWVGVNTMVPNRTVARLLATGRIPELRGYSQLRREVPCGISSRIDVLLWNGDGDWRTSGPGARCWVEVKNATLRLGEHACFPDAVTERGTRHLAELARRVRRGERAVMFFFVNRADCRRFRPAHEIDPTYATALRRAARSGVEILAYRFRAGPRGPALASRLPVDLPAVT